MKCKKRPNSRETRWDAKERFIKRQTKGSTYPPGPEVVIPIQRLKRVKDNWLRRSGPGTSTCILISVVQDQGRGKRQTAWQECPRHRPLTVLALSPSDSDVVRFWHLAPQGESPFSFISCFRAALRMLTSESRRALLRLPALGPPRSSPGVPLPGTTTHAPQSWSDLQCRPRSSWPVRGSRPRLRPSSGHPLISSGGRKESRPATAPRQAARRSGDDPETSPSLAVATAASWCHLCASGSGARYGLKPPSAGVGPVHQRDASVAATPALENGGRCEVRHLSSCPQSESEVWDVVVRTESDEDLGVNSW